MTWQTAKSAAAESIRRLNLPADLTGSTIRLADYESNAELTLIKSRREWPLEFHRMVNGAMARELRRRGAVVHIVRIRAADYFSWIEAEGLSNGPAERARFIATDHSNPSLGRA